MLIKKVTEKKDVIESYYNSSNILKSVYHVDTKDLDVVFKRGAVYRYVDVPLKLFEQFERDQSQGKFLNKRIKDTYTTNKVADVNTQQLVESINKMIQRDGKINSIIGNSTDTEVN
tara:strand:- start:10367 stop:10714 length:348 start_codon:yes stop_codon:yes gene_type:complete